MTIWNCIRDWFVQYVFGGYASNGDFYGDNVIGGLSYNSGGETLTTHWVGFDNVLVDAGDLVSGGQSLAISIGDWLSTTATIITLCLLVFMLYLFARWIFKQCAGLLSF